MRIVAGVGAGEYGVAHPAGANGYFFVQPDNWKLELIRKRRSEFLIVSVPKFDNNRGDIPDMRLESPVTSEKGREISDCVVSRSSSTSRNPRAEPFLAPRLVRPCVLHEPVYDAIVIHRAVPHFSASPEFPCTQALLFPESMWAAARILANLGTSEASDSI